MNFEDAISKLGDKRTGYKPPVQNVKAIEVPMTVVLQDKLKERLHKKAIIETARGGERVYMRDLFIEAVEQKLLKHKTQPYKIGQEYKGDEWRTNYYVSSELNKKIHLFKVENNIFIKQFFNEAVHEYLKPATKVKQMTIDDQIQRDS